VVSFDTIIRGGRWFDGTGAPSALRNIGIRDGRIAAVTPDELDATGCPEVVDAVGKWVLPGFIDIHTHYDVEVLDGPGLLRAIGPSPPAPPVVFLTGYGDHGDDELIALGARAVLGKPVSGRRLLDAVNTWAMPPKAA
jgi:CheY-like chemotaxis protein